MSSHYDLNTDKVCNSLRIQVLIDTCTMRHLRITKGHWIPISILSMECRFIKTNYLALLIAQTKRTDDKNVIVLLQPVGFKAEAVDEEGVWCAHTAEEVSNNQLRDRFV